MNGRLNIGAGFTLNLLSLQFYLLTNDVLSLTNPIKGQIVDWRVGINRAFGNKKRVNRRLKKEA